jgi:hypothetical protein
MMRTALLLLAALTVGAHAALAQRPRLDSLPAGARVRVTAPPHERTTGTVLGVRGDTLLLLRARSKDTLPVVLSAVRSAEVSRGTRTRISDGITLGALGGALLGAAVEGVVLLNLDDGGMCGDGCAMLLATGAGLAAGAVLGGIAGTVPVERWQPVTWRGRSSRTGLMVPTYRSGIGLAMTLGF